MPITATEIGRFLKNNRENVGLTQKELSKQLGYTSPQIISNVERGLAGPPLLKAVQWADYTMSSRHKVKLLMIKRYKKQLEDIFDVN